MIVCITSLFLNGCTQIDEIKGRFISGNNAEESTSKNSAEEIIPVEVSTPFVKDISVSSNFSGTVTAESEVQVVPMVAGEVVEKNFEVGDHVNEGDLLFRIDDTALQIAVNQAEASVTSAKASLNAQSATANATKAQATQTVGEIPYNAAAMNNAVDLAYAQKRSANDSLKSANLNVSELQKDINNTQASLDSLRSQREGAIAKNDEMQSELAQFNSITDESAKEAGCR